MQQTVISQDQETTLSDGSATTITFDTVTHDEISSVTPDVSNDKLTITTLQESKIYFIFLTAGVAEPQGEPLSDGDELRFGYTYNGNRTQLGGTTVHNDGSLLVFSTMSPLIVADGMDYKMEFSGIISRDLAITDARFGIGIVD
ncbi:hypothetical protein [Halapricum hydrolyticum]|uniref:Uncharacterized protein n=1 Tax=Halapricum hydrolyticum TaxID=2979991 RepID=A0AAE3IAJ9_9EURY|nr:hypothetical protein [Halapricum hydrolyticum]MCU4716867.1 hypothetical protein [Halapricum hydrolyticum]MCU4725528.1 hypothetical protein [Halapricum hydrolyticum]